MEETERSFEPGGHSFDILGVTLGEFLPDAVQSLEQRKRLAGPAVVETVHDAATQAKLMFEDGGVMFLRASVDRSLIYRLTLLRQVDKLTPFSFFCDHARDALSRKYGPPALSVARAVDDSEFDFGVSPEESMELIRDLWGNVVADDSEAARFRAVGPYLKADCRQEMPSGTGHFSLSLELVDEAAEADAKAALAKVAALDGETKIAALFRDMDF